MAAPSWTDYFGIGVAEAIDRRPDLTFEDGDISEMFVAGMAAMADHLTGYFAGRFKATYVDGASGDDLTRLAADHWNIQRYPASSAHSTVTLSRAANPSAPAGQNNAGDIVATQKDATGSQIQYTLDNAVIWTLGDSADKTMTVTAVIAGSGGNSDVDTINTFITAPFDSTITVNNPTDKAAGGDEAESDPDLRERVRNFPATLRRATIAALEYAATAADADVKKSFAQEETVDNVLTGIVNLYIADSTGNANSIMADEVTTELVNWRAAGMIVNVFAGAVYTQDVAVSITARIGVDTQTLVANAEAAIIARIGKLLIGETLTIDMIQQAVRNVSDDILIITVTNPAVDVTPPANGLIQPGTVVVS